MTKSGEKVTEVCGGEPAVITTTCRQESPLLLCALPQDSAKAAPRVRKLRSPHPLAPPDSGPGPAASSPRPFAAALRLAGTCERPRAGRHYSARSHPAGPSVQAGWGQVGAET